ncbi:MAG: YraN family protein [Methylocystis sp.]
MKPPSSRKRRAGHDFGLRAESLAAIWLRMRFYKILARRYRVNGGEIDIIARRGDAIAFVEVKAREEMDDALIAITPQKQRRLSIAAARWLAANPWAANYTLRADAVFIAPRRLPRHVIDVMELRIG